MSLIPDAEIERIKSGVDIVEVIGSRIQLKTVGREKVALCPFHDEHSPSFTVTPSKQLYYCFGCGATGDAIRFVALFEGKSFLDSLRVLADMANLPMPQANERPSALQSLQRAMAYYQQQLKKDTPESARCREYIASRGISAETVESFGLGLAPTAGRALHGALKDCFSDLVSLGLVDKLKSGNGHLDRFRGRLVIPVRSPGGQVIGLTGRTLVGETPKYINSQLTEWFKKDKALFGIDQFRQATRASAGSRADKVYVVEGQSDVLTTHSAGESRIVGVLGRSVSQEQARTLLSLADTVIFTFDGDQAGESSIEATMRTLLGASGESGRVRFKRLPSGEDPSSLIKGHGLEAFYAAPETGFLETLVSLLPSGDTPDAQLALAEAGMEFVALAKDSLLRDAVIRAIARAADLSPDALSERYASQIASKPAPRAAVSPSAAVRPIVQQQYFSPEAALWRTMLEAPELLKELSWPSLMSGSSDPVLSTLPLIARQADERSVEPTASMLSTALDTLGLNDLVQTIYAMPAPSNPRAEALDVLAMLEQQLIKIEIAKFIARVKAGERLTAEDRAAYTALVQQKTKLNEVAAA